MPIELLAPAKDIETGLTAINCGADAVYIGASRFGAREAAGNDVSDVEELIRYAHKYWAKVYVVVNTLLYNSEIPEALKLINQIYQSGADALIIQDVGLLECDLPPIPLFASTQMHNHTPERVAFLEKAGFQRVILARELSLEQIREIRASTSIELETFIHGALCVSYSGQCYLSYAIGGRSGNRGQCAQPCRNLYSLTDDNGNILTNQRHLLSIRDLNQTKHLHSLIDAGVTSFKIEGRLKDKTYVMNVVGHYRKLLDQLGTSKTSSGEINLGFEPDPQKTFNRGYCDYFIMGRQSKIGSPDTPKMVGEKIGKVKAIQQNSFCLEEDLLTDPLHNGDGICFFAQSGDLTGTLVNQVNGNWITPAKMQGVQPGLPLYRNHDKTFIDALLKSNPNRKIRLEMNLSQTPTGCRLDLCDENDVEGSAELEFSLIPAEKSEQALEMIKKQLLKLGETDFVCQKIDIALHPVPFLPTSLWNELRRKAVENLANNRIQQRPENEGTLSQNHDPFPQTDLDYSGNVLNEKAADFYRHHGVQTIQSAAEGGLPMRGRKVMTTKYCLRYEMDACLREKNAQQLPDPLYLIDADGHRLKLKFDCKACQMEVFFAG